MTDRAVALVVLGVAFVLALPGFVLRADPTSDGLFYEARAAKLDGMSRDDAFRAVFQGPRGHEVAAIEGSDRITDPRWYEYTAPFYERRWLVPALAVVTANLTGWTIADAMQRVSMFGYVLIGPLLFLLLRRRFPTWPSIAGALGCLLLPPLYRWSFGPLVDSWGLALMTLGLLALILAADRGLRWLPLWVLTVAALSVTRDATLVLLICAFGLLLAQRRDQDARKRNLVLAATGALAALPAPLLWGARLKDNFVYVIHGYNVPEREEGWGFVIEHFPHQLWFTIKANLEFPLKAGIGAPAMYLGLAFVCLLCLSVLVVRARADAFWTVIQTSAVGGVLLLLLALNPQGFRYELVFVPLVATGLALGWTRASALRTDGIRLLRTSGRRLDY
jgi:hypothetical protein